MLRVEIGSGTHMTDTRVGLGRSVFMARTSCDEGAMNTILLADV